MLQYIQNSWQELCKEGGSLLDFCAMWFVEVTDLTEVLAASIIRAMSEETTRHNNPEDSHLNIRLSENLRS
jgi:hypothetical protein